jgi:hypothetical protein
MLGIHDLSVILFGSILLNKPDLSGIAVKTDGQVGDSFHDLGIGEHKIFSKKVWIEGLELYLVKDFVGEDPVKCFG